MVKYIRAVNENVDKTVSARGDDLRASFKNTHQTGRAIRGLSLPKARAYLQAVLEHKRCIPFRKYNGGIGRTAQAKEFKVTQGRWPEKSVKIFLSLIQNLEANARSKDLDVSNLYVWHCAVQRAMRGRRRTYRAHGRINPYMSNPCHVEIICKQKAENVPKAISPDHDSIAMNRKANADRQLRVAF